MFDNAKKMIKLPYYYVDNCPSCGSRVTGRYVKASRPVDNEWMIDQALKNGELLKTVPEVLGPNCFCLECGQNFSFPVQRKMLTIDEIKEEKIERHTVEILNDRLSDEYHQKATGVLGLFINFVGKI